MGNFFRDELRITEVRHLIVLIQVSELKRVVYMIKKESAMKKSIGKPYEGEQSVTLSKMMH